MPEEDPTVQEPSGGRPGGLGRIRPTTYSPCAPPPSLGALDYRVDGGGGNGEAAGCSICGGGGKGEEDGCICGGSGNGLPRGAVLAAVLVRDNRLEIVLRRGRRLWKVRGGGGTGWSTTWTGLGTRVGGGLSQNECSGGGPSET